jgi:hypothetical protein
LSGGSGRKALLFRVRARMSEVELREFVHALLHQPPAGAIWMIPVDRARLKGKYRVVDTVEQRGELVAHVLVERLDELEWRSRSGISRFAWRREGGAGELEGELSERALAKLVSVVGLERVEAKLVGELERGVGGRGVAAGDRAGRGEDTAEG